jgi:hypothetical protein
MGPTGFASHRDALKRAATVHGGTSLKLSEGSESPLLEAHPGSPVDLTGRRPSLATSMAASRRHFHGRQCEISKPERSPQQLGKKDDVIMADGVAAKGHCSVGNRCEQNEHECTRSPKRRMQVAAVQPFFIPAKVPEQEEIHHIPSPVDDRMSIDTATETTAMDFHFEEENGIWISAIPIAHESRTSIATTTTAASTLVDDRMSHGALTVDTSVASSAASMMSSAASIQSATTNSSDIYGWEEELDRKSVEAHNPWNREIHRRLPSGGRTIGPRMRGEYPIYKRAESKRKSLLHRVLNISGSRGRDSDEVGTATPMIGYSATPA